MPSMLNYDNYYFSDDGDDYHDRPSGSSRRRSTASRTWAREPERPSMRNTIKNSLRRRFSSRDDSRDRQLKPARERRPSAYPSQHHEKPGSWLVTGPGGGRGVWLYFAPSDCEPQFFPTPPPKAHGWTKMFMPYDDNDDDDYMPKLSPAEPHSPGASPGRSSSQRTRRHSPYGGDRHYADGFNDWRSDRDENNARRRAKQQESYRPAYEGYAEDDDYPDFGRSSPPRSSYSGRDRSTPPFGAYRGYSPSPRHSSPLPSRSAPAKPDYYAILGISPNATSDEIRSAAKKRRIQFHPDKVRRDAMKGGKTLSRAEEEKIEKKAKEVGEAAEVLENWESKREYDDDRRYGGR